MSKYKCGDCRFFEFEDSTCRANPPVPVLFKEGYHLSCTVLGFPVSSEVSKTPTPEYNGVFPFIGANGWCGKFEQEL